MTDRTRGTGGFDWAAGKKVEPGDGSRQPRLRPWHFLVRTMLLTRVPDQHGVLHDHAVHVKLLADEKGARHYRDRVQVAVGDLPVKFAVPGGRLEVATSIFGLSRAHHVRDDGTEQVMTPAPGSAEHARARFGRRFPRTSRLIGAVAIVICLAGVAIAVPQLLELVTHWPPVADRIDWSFDSPVSLPAWANTSLFVAGLLAGTERALTLRNHWLIDADTWVLGP
ncbi:MAG TPA: hypothetical protein VGE77_07480 [Nocardioides sp.]